MTIESCWTCRCLHACCTLTHPPSRPARLLCWWVALPQHPACPACQRSRCAIKFSMPERACSARLAIHTPLCAEEQCDDAVAAALESGTLVPSKVGGAAGCGLTCPLGPWHCFRRAFCSMQLASAHSACAVPAAASVLARNAATACSSACSTASSTLCYCMLHCMFFPQPLQVGGGNLKDMAYADDNPYRTSSR